MISGVASTERGRGHAFRRDASGSPSASSSCTRASTSIGLSWRFPRGPRPCQLVQQATATALGASVGRADALLPEEAVEEARPRRFSTASGLARPLGALSSCGPGWFLRVTGSSDDSTPRTGLQNFGPASQSGRGWARLGPLAGAQASRQGPGRSVAPSVPWRARPRPRGLRAGASVVRPDRSACVARRPPRPRGRSAPGWPSRASAPRSPCARTGARRPASRPWSPAAGN